MKLTSITTLSGALAAVLLAGNYAKAGYITGQIEFGDVNSPAAVVTLGEVNPTNPAEVTSGTGNYSGLITDAATFDPVIFAPQTTGLLWTIVEGATTYTFTINSFTSTYQNGYFVNLAGSGTATETGFSDTNGTWSITDTNSNGSGLDFTFGASSNVANTPDSGTTALLISLGLAGIGIGVFAQRRKAVKA